MNSTIFAVKCTHYTVYVVFGDMRLHTTYVLKPINIYATLSLVSLPLSWVKIRTLMEQVL